MNLHNLSDEKLDQQTFESVKAETESTLRVLHHLREIDRRKLFSKLKYKSLLDYAEKRLGYPYDQAWRRIEAMRLLKEMPEIEVKIADGTLNLTNLGYAQAAFKSEAKKETPLCREEKLEFLSQIENKTTRVTQKLVADKFGSEALLRETIKPVSATVSMLNVPVKDEFLEKLDELKGLLAHSHSTTTELLEYAVCTTIEKLRRQKLGGEKVAAPRKPSDQSRSSESRYVTAADRRQIWSEAKAQCVSCGSTYKLEIDHIIPFGKGGTSEAKKPKIALQKLQSPSWNRSIWAEKNDKLREGAGRNLCERSLNRDEQLQLRLRVNCRVKAPGHLDAVATTGVFFSDPKNRPKAIGFLMFSGIVEAQSEIVSTSSQPGILRITVQKPVDFNDIKPGDSIAVNGICLTVENFDQSKIEFALAAETLRVTGWSGQTLKSAKVNLERSLRMGDRVHGHFVSGHVDAMGKVKSRKELGGSLELDISFPSQLKPYIWKKGSWALNGVSLTVNEVGVSSASVCLIPETQERTNLSNLKTGDSVTIEVDPLARGLIHVINTRNDNE